MLIRRPLLLYCVVLSHVAFPYDLYIMPQRETVHGDFGGTGSLWGIIP